MTELLCPPQPPAPPQTQPPPAFLPLIFRPDARGPRLAWNSHILSISTYCHTLRLRLLSSLSRIANFLCHPSIAQLSSSPWSTSTCRCIKSISISPTRPLQLHHAPEVWTMVNPPDAVISTMESLPSLGLSPSPARAQPKPSTRARLMFQASLSPGKPSPSLGFQAKPRPAHH
jgi:hypothetical protein